MAVETSTAVAVNLLRWYDRHARDLPWRTPPGGNGADPYRVWLSEIMLQQTTVATVRDRFAAFVTRWPTISDLAAAPPEDVLAAWAGLGYYARARNLIACAQQIMADHGGRFPGDEATLLTLPGIGHYTAAAIAAFAFGARAVVVDSNVERVISRLFAIDTPLPASRPIIRDRMDLITPDARAGDFAQAVMDLAATLCLPKRTDCLPCPLRAHCAAARDSTPTRFPVKAARKVRPVRKGEVWWIERDGHVLLTRRPDNGMLGGMRALPGNDWTDAAADYDAPIRHIFTHFELRLAIRCRLPEEIDQATLAGEWWPIATIDQAGLPTLYTKAVAWIRGSGE